MRNKQNNKLKLIKLLKEIFRFDSEDLDFGIYKIMNYKRREISGFIEKELIERIEEQLTLLSEKEKEKIIVKDDKLKEKDSVIKYLEAIRKEQQERINILEELEDIKEYKKIQEELKNIKVSEDAEKSIYNHLVNFFSRYYDNGDFISKRRFGRGERYTIPYNGEEKLLYWANKDQYYIKTTEYFKKYTFKATSYKDALVVNFRIIEAEEEKGNIRPEEKKFFVLSSNAFELEKNELNIYFEYRGLTGNEEEKFGQRAKQEVINKYIVETLREKLGKDTKTAILFSDENGIEKHLNRYTKRNTRDYFIHKNLKEFLEKELDFYIKNEVLSLENLQVLEKSDYYEKIRLYLLEARVIRNIALKIIGFLAQIEEFQKKVWEKKKFVLKTDYVVTLDRVKQYAGESFLESILDEILHNKAQLKEWEELLGVKVKKRNDLMTDIKFDGKEWKKLPIDTKYFDEEFKWKLIVNLSRDNHLDHILDGVLIRSENWQALDTVINKYREKVQTIYIDPPFNTGEDFLYKDKYRDSSWLSLMKDRITLAKNFLNNTGSFLSHLDRNANFLGRILLDSVFNEKNFKADISWDTCGITGFKTSPNNWIKNSDNIFHYCRSTKDNFFVKPYTIINVDSPQKAKEERKEKELGWLDILERDGEYYVEKWDDERLVNKSIEVKNKLDPIGMIWTDIHSFLYTQVANNESFFFKTQKPENLLRRIIQCTTKQKDIVMDFFLGLGTTIAVAHKLNRKWIGIEMGDFFNTIYSSGYKGRIIKKIGILGRMKIVLFGDQTFHVFGHPRHPQLSRNIEWKGGGFFKYHCLEQYEDALENIEFEQKTPPNFKDYLVHYMFNFETKNSRTFLNISNMEDPFNYKLKIIEDYQPKTVNIDLIETFNYLLGVSVKKLKQVEKNKRKYRLVFGEINNKRVVIVWRPIKNMDFEEDKRVVEENIKEFNPDEIYANGDCAVKNFRQIESEFKKLMFEKVK